MDDRQVKRREWAAIRHERQAAVVSDIEAQARAAQDDLPAGVAWLGVQRQARRYLRGLHARAADGSAAAHQGALQGAVERARSTLAALDPAVVTAARAQLGLRVALVGKGGTGKSVISATLARLLARRGRPVLAADLDLSPGLAYSIGVDPGMGVLRAAVEAHPGATYGFGLAPRTRPADAVMTHGAVGPDGVRFVSVGKIVACDKSSPRETVGATLEVLAGFGEPGWDVIGDLEAGPTSPFERFHAFADLVLLVVTPTWVSAMTARRLRPLVDDVATLVVANGFRQEPAHDGLVPVARIPFDPAVAEAERLGLAPLDHCPDSPAVAAIARLADHLTQAPLTAVAARSTPAS